MAVELAILKILFVTLMLPDPSAHHASAFTVFRTIKHLSKRHDVSLLSFVRHEEERNRAGALGEYCRSAETVPVPSGLLQKLRVRAGLLAMKSIAVSNSFSRTMAASISAMCDRENFDIVQLEYSPMAQYAAAVRDLPVIISVHDVHGQIQTRVLARTARQRVGIAALWHPVRRRRRKLIIGYQRHVLLRRDITTTASAQST